MVKGSASEEVKNKLKAAESAIEQIKSRFGDGAIMTFGEAKASMQVESIPTGCMSLDIALGIKGVPRGRIIEIYGPEASGKTTLALHVVAEMQKRSGIAAFVDAEHAFDPDYARKIGIKIDELLISQPDTGEQALEIVETLVRSNAVDVIVVDSVAALVPKAEIEGDMGDAQMGLQARLMSQALRKLTGIISKTKSFKTANVSPEILNIASELIQLGADRKDIVTHLYQTKTIATLKLWGKVLSRLQTDLGYRLVWSKLDVHDFTESGAAEKDLAGVIDDLIANSPLLDIAVLFYQTRPEKTKILIYAAGRYNALHLTRQFMPAGDRQLAVVEIEADLDKAEKLILPALTQQLEQRQL